MNLPPAEYLLSFSENPRIVCSLPYRPDYFAGYNCCFFHTQNYLVSLGNSTSTYPFLDSPSLFQIVLIPLSSSFISHTVFAGF